MSNACGRAVGRMGGWAVGRLGGWAACRPGPLGKAIAVLAILSAHPPIRLSAQVGYEPSRSPFRDIGSAQQLGFLVGRFSGAAGYAGVGAQPATAFGIRFRNRLSGPLDLTINAGYVGSERLFLDPTLPDSTRNRGNVDFSMITADIGISLSLTGQKSWHGLAPWIGIGIGLVTPTSPTTDPGGFKASAGFTLVPAVGTRLFLSPQLALQLEFRDNTIRYEYPLAYFNPTDPSTGATLPPAIIPLTRTNKQLTHNFTLSVGASYHFNF